MSTKISIDQSNPFTETECVVNSIEDLNRINTKVEFKSENGIIVALPDGNTSLLMNTSSEELSAYESGDDIDIYTDSEGNAYKANEKYDLYKSILSKAKEGHIFNGKVIDVTKQGLLVTIDGLQSFMPQGQIGNDKSKDLQSYIGKTIDVKLISIKLKEKEGNRFLPVVSHKAIDDEKNDALAQEKLSMLKVGDTVTGKVKSVANYGVFVTLFPSVDGLIHITDLSWEKVSNPAEIVSVDQQIDVVILDMKQMKDGNHRISLGLKQLTQKPWARFDKNSKVGDIVSGTVCNIADYGIFVKLPCGVEGLVHRTELSWDTTVTSKSFQKGDTIMSKIINIDWEKEKLLLSIKQTQQDPWINITDKYSIGDIIDTTISNIKNFGLFVKIDQGIEGLIHVSELSWTDKIQKPQLIYNIGDSIKAIIINIDEEKRTLELSHKRLQMDPLENHQIGEHVNAIVVDTIKKGIQLKLEKDNLPAFIPAHIIPDGESFVVGTTLNCVIKEIDKDKRRIIVAIE
jgi:small subunit ribosomal protein S1